MQPHTQFKVVDYPEGGKRYPFQYICKTCGKRFRHVKDMNAHRRGKL